jgi:NitT/TauT family transport system substrate-binding protein
MKSKKARIVSIAVSLFMLLTLVAGCVTYEYEPVVRMPKLVLVAPPGPMAIPLAYITVNDKLSAIAEETELVIWENPDQLKAIIAGNQGDFVTLTSNAAATFYTKGLGGQLLDISVWNILYVISSDATVGSLADIQSQKIVVPFKGSMPDLLYQYVCTKQVLDPFDDFDLQYAANPQQAAQMLLSGEVNHAVLPEPLATAVLLQTKDSETPLHRSVRFETEWAKATGGESKTPIAGTIALASVQDKSEVINEFLKQYGLAVEWMLAHPDEAGVLMEEQLPELGFKAKPMTASLQNITWEFVQAKDARQDVELFFTALTELSPEVIGGQLPDDGFYYQGADLE